MTSPTVASALTTNKTHLPATSLSRVTPKTRTRAAERGEAMSDGSFPVRDAADLRRAIQAFGRAKDKGAAKRHIIRRAKALDKVDMLPESWRSLAVRSLPQELSAARVVSAASADAVLAAKAVRHNALAPDDRQVTPAKLKVVYRRGADAYDDRPGVTRDQYAHARVNSFLRLLASGAPDSPHYHADDDLLPVSHLCASQAPPPFAGTRQGT